jgi:hypothetical protein
MKHTSLWLIGLACFAAGCVAMRSAQPSFKSTTYYTKANIWYTDPQDIRTSNYHAGALLPFGTPVAIQAMNSEVITFTAPENRKFVIRHAPRHSRISLAQHFDRYFTTQDPKSAGSDYDHYSDTEKTNVAKGNLCVGMSRSSVLAAYGYPPSHATPDLASDFWRYWLIGRQEVQICFTAGQVSRIDLLSVSGPPPGHKTIRSVTDLDKER